MPVPPDTLTSKQGEEHESKSNALLLHSDKPRPVPYVAIIQTILIMTHLQS